MFFSWEKYIISHFAGFFWGGLDFFDVEIALRFAQDDLDIKKVLAPSKKNPAKWLIMCFSRIKKKVPHF
jgi:hypothetical protein